MTKHRHFIIHKPIDYISQFVYNQTKRKNKKLLGELYDFPEGTMAIGRLDKKSEGLILLTTDGKVSEEVRSKLVEKEYYVQVDGIIGDEAIELLKLGVDISINGQKYRTLKCKAHRLPEEPNFKTESKLKRGESHGPTSWVSITLTEGKNKQVRKMTAAVGFPTLRLVRVRIGNITLGKLAAGDVVETDRFDIAMS